MASKVDHLNVHILIDASRCQARTADLRLALFATRLRSVVALSKMRDGKASLMIVDKPPKEFLEAYKGVLVRKTIENRPYQGGYPDFIPYDSLDIMRQKPAPSRTSLFDDLYHYFQNHSEVLEVDKNPLSVDLLLRNHIEWQTSRQERLESLTIPWLQQRWNSIHNFHRRCEDYTYAIDAIIRNLELNRDAGLDKDWNTSAADFKDIQARFGEIRRKSEGLIASFSGLSGIISSRESLREARTVGHLTLLGMIFLPLSFASGLFSMSDDYLPGAKNFGTYWTVSIPIITAIFVIPFVMRLGYETPTRESSREWFKVFARRISGHDRDDKHIEYRYWKKKP